MSKLPYDEWYDGQDHSSYIQTVGVFCATQLGMTAINPALGGYALFFNMSSAYSYHKNYHENMRKKYERYLQN
ncbi:MAG: hypothetical protein QNJ42_23340 [Crocosphaera sp.]|nr:hypothetical protein [Crocosphaera sp.]